MHIVDLEVAGDRQVRRWTASCASNATIPCNPKPALIEQPRHFCQRAPLQLHAHIELLPIPVSANEKMPKFCCAWSVRAGAPDNRSSTEPSSEGDTSKSASFR